MESIIIGKRDDIRDAAAMTFTGNVMLANGQTLAGHVTPCDIVGSQRTGIFTDITVSSTRSGAFRRVRLADVQFVEIWDI